MAASFQQAQAEGLVLRHPENFGQHREITLDQAVTMLLRAITMSQSVPFSWSYIDKPPEGQLYLLFMGPGSAFPNDGIRWQEMETRHAIPAPNSRELEVHEVKYGFIPGSGDTTAWRIRRRYRLSRGGLPSLSLVHYTRGAGGSIMPSLMNQPLRAYPLRPVNEPALFIAGEKIGQKVYPPGTVPPPGGGGGPGIVPIPGMPMNLSQQQAMLAQQNNRMDMLEARRDRERARTGNTVRPPPMLDDDSGDEAEMVSTKSLALTRYRRNHDLMNEVFMHAAFGDKHKKPPTSSYSIFKKEDLEEQCSQLNAEIEVLQTRSSERKSRSTVGDVSMSDPITV
ncbi:hypothetical protein E1B28_012903 [Marasmius oreades]|uniref:SWI/SNF and RSC complexes subunit Ssr4 N-terminal domain-containing protein n=1 Tax=Marasmius oreades TaxID=181124 RepID=A0A9P7RT77_9AGAR|nr:uncharacterized protein E1B28_012903 [Marasmius oreades]KAG7088958.1 hypothetical protein E1B28_012903 [Marasmius oreades]